jgi:hypothetical protein
VVIDTFLTEENVSEDGNSSQASSDGDGPDEMDID